MPHSNAWPTARHDGGTTRARAAVTLSGRGSRAAALVTALVVALPVYYPLLELGTVLAREGSLPAGLAMNLGNLVLLLAGCALLHRTFTR